MCARSQDNGVAFPCDVTKEMIVSGPNLLARGLSARSHLDRCKCLGAGKDFVIWISKAPDLASGPVNFDLQKRRRRCPVRRVLECPCGRRLPHVAGWCSLTARRQLPGSTGQMPGMAAPRQPSPARCTGVIDFITFGDWKTCAAPMESNATAPRYASNRTNLDGSSSRHERRAGCMRLSAAVCRCVEGCSRLEALPSGCPVPAVGW